MAWRVYTKGLLGIFTPSKTFKKHSTAKRFASKQLGRTVTRKVKKRK